MPARSFTGAVAACAFVMSLAGPATADPVASGSRASAAIPDPTIKQRPDRTWMVDGKVYALARAQGTLYIGGRFSKLLPPRGSGGARAIRVGNLAAIDLSSGRPVRSWRPRASGASGVVDALAVADGRVYVGGSFERLAGADVQNLGAVKVNGNAVPRFDPQVSGRVHALLTSRRLLYVGGAFGPVDGSSRAKLAAVRMTSGRLSSAWRPRAVGGAVRDLESDRRRGSIFVAGAFSGMAQGGETFARESLAKVDARTGDLLDWATPAGSVGSPQTAWSIELDGPRLHGGFGRGANFAASFRSRGDVGTRIWRYDVPGNVQTVELSKGGNRLFLGGHFGLAVGDERACGRDLRGLVSVDPDTGEPICDWVPQLAPFQSNFDGPWAMMAVGRELWVGGGWGKVAGVVQRGLARFDFG